MCYINSISRTQYCIPGVPLIYNLEQIKKKIIFCLAWLVLDIRTHNTNLGKREPIRFPS